MNLSAVFGGYGVNATTVLGALPVLIGAMAKLPGWFTDFNERADKIKTAKLAWMLEALKDSRHIHSPGLLREIVAKLAYGYLFMLGLIAFGDADLCPPDRAVRICKGPQA